MRRIIDIVRAGANLARAALLAAAAGAAAGPAYSQGARTLEIDVADCVGIESPAERFRCYESRVDAALGESSATAREDVPTVEPLPEAEVLQEAESTPAAVPSAPAAGVIGEREIVPGPSADADDFGLRPAEDRGDRRARRRRDREREELFGVVASLRETVPNSYVITLENGQVWRQVRPSFYPLRPGQTVRIYSTNWGDSYRMSAEELNGFIQVERVR